MSPDPTRLARRLAYGGAGAAIPAWLALDTVAGLATLDAALLAVLLVLMPGLALAQVPLIDDEPLPRLAVYWTSIVALSLLGGITLWVGTRGPGPATPGLTPPGWVDLSLWTAALTVGGLLAMVAAKSVGERMGTGDAAILDALLPREPRERAAFVVLSMAAGFGEEIAYRWFAIPVLSGIVGVWGSVAATSAVFGLLHAYQGALGIVRAGSIGALMAVGFVVSGSVWAPVLAHAALDVIAGLVLGRRLMALDRRPSTSD